MTTTPTTPIHTSSPYWATTPKQDKVQGLTVSHHRHTTTTTITTTSAHYNYTTSTTTTTITSIRGPLW
ncbi:hypothetical protein E2C01_028301 [Portunus trituberculatus]|uniref:Uncharacterized protein n=1 Tax=Portunus trituberculatus TaxID=210409 RepID=A0A5B7ENQ6_PORTR|nr:hypothetical protein [Portunus trituberculatus]